MMKKLLLAMMMLTMTVSGYSAEEWVDVTNVYMVNPTFASGSTGWTKEGSCGSFGAVNYSCMEFWNGWFRASQTLKGLAPGHYRLSVQAFYRCGDFSEVYPEFAEGIEEVPANVFAENQAEMVSVPVASVFNTVFHPERNFGNNWWSPDGTDFYPNQMATASEAFGQGEYWNVLEFDADGEATVGLECWDYRYSNWCIFSNFRLEYWGDPTANVVATAISMHLGQTTLQQGESTQATITYTPANTSLQRVELYSNNVMVATVGDNGMVLARNPGETTIAANTLDGSGLTATANVSVTAKPTDSDDRDWLDVTDIYLKTPAFDGNDRSGWTTNRGGGNTDTQYGCLEFWNTPWFDLSQELHGLPRGHYRLSVNAYHRYGSPTADLERYCDNKPSALAYLYAGEERQTVREYLSAWLDTDFYEEHPYNPDGYSNADYWHLNNDYHLPNTMWCANNAFSQGLYLNQMEFDAEGDITIGVALDEYTSENWFICDNFRLEYLGEVIVPTAVSLTFADTGTNRTELKAGESVQCLAEISPEGAMVKAMRWESADTKVATVDDNGLVTAVGTGSAVIRLNVTKPDGKTLTGRCKVTVVRDELKTGDLLFNEVMARNIDEYVSPAFNFDGWAELYNNTSADVGLTGFYLSDDAANPTKWRIPVQVGMVPAHGHLVLWFGSDDIAPQNVPFKLDSDGGSLWLSDDNGREIATITYPAATARTSYARTTDGGDVWSLTATPTPGTSNTSATYAEQQLAEPVVDQPSQLFSGQLCVNVAIPAGATLRYTTDGTLPTSTNGETSPTGQFVFSETTSLRFRLFAPGMLPSPVATRSYLLRDREYMLPVVSVVSDPAFLYGSEIGVFAYGPNGRPGNGQSANCNFNMNWQRPVNFSYITADGDMALNQDVSLEVCGGWSRAWNPRAFKLKGNKTVGGQKQLPYPFFTEKPYIRNRTLQLRNGGNDTQCRFLDPALQYMIQTAQIDLDVQSYQPVHEFINGQYIGVLNMREPNNKHYVYANYGWDDDEIDQFEMSPDSGYVQKCGTPDAFEQLVDLSADAALQETYDEICRLLDIDAYANYMAAEMYLGNWDWPQNNVKGFRHRDGGKFRFVLFDLDGSFSTYDSKAPNATVPFESFQAKETYQFDQLYPTSLGRITAPIRFVTLFRNLLRNDQFRRRFIDAYAMMGGSIYEAQRAAQIADLLAANAEPAMQLNGASVYPTANNVKNNLRSRLDYSTGRLMAYAPMQLDGVSAQHVTLTSDVADAQLYVNNMLVPTDRFNGYLFAPATLRAVAPAGYAFQGWVNSAGGNTLIDYGATWSYSDNGSLDGQQWYAANYNARNWNQGQAPFGYGKNGVATEINQSRYWGENHSTVYFRNTFNLSQTPQAGDEFRLDITVDDGAIIYVNGTEAARYNMPDGQVGYDTYAQSYAPGNPDETSIAIAPSLLHRGSNTIAVELHNNAATSTDLYWDARLVQTTSQAGADYVSTDAEMPLPQGNVSLVASFREMTAAEMTQEGITPVRINEVSGSNDSYVNEYGKKGDWVELYNTTSHDIDVEGMYLSDNADTPQKYQLSKAGTRANTVIPAHGHLVVWCDKLATTDQALHASFKISGEGGKVILTAADRSWTDVVSYGLHDATTTIGRYPDGCADVYAMATPTIGHTNLLTSYAQPVNQDDPDKDGIATVAAANGLRICYAAGQLQLRADEASSAVVEIFATDGRLVDRQQVQFAGGMARLSVAHLPAGFYVARATDNNDTRVGCKFMR